MEDFFRVGIITAPHGLRGEVKVYPTTDDAKRFKRLKKVTLIPAEDGQESKTAHTPGGTAAADPKSKKAGNSAGVEIGAGEERSIDLEIESVRFFKQFVILKFKGIDRIEDVEKYRRYSLMVSRSDAVRLGRDEYFIADLIGLSVLNEDGTEIGVLKDVLETGANDVYVIELNDKMGGVHPKELLLPAIKQCVLEVNAASGFIRIHILEGLLEV